MKTDVVAALIAILGKYITDIKTWSDAASKIVLGAGSDRAAAAARQLIAPDIYSLTIMRILNVLWRFRDQVEPAALAIVVRGDCIEPSCGCTTASEQAKFARILRWTRQRAEPYLMTQDEILRLATLPENVTVYRGQRPESHPKSRGITGMSWTIERQIADSYTFTPEWPRGWLLTATVDKKDILMHLSACAESEVLIEPKRVRLLNAERGAANDYPRRSGREYECLL